MELALYLFYLWHKEMTVSFFFFFFSQVKFQIKTTKTISTYAAQAHHHREPTRTEWGRGFYRQAPGDGSEADETQLSVMSLTQGSPLWAWTASPEWTLLWRKTHRSLKESVKINSLTYLLSIAVQFDSIWLRFREWSEQTIDVWSSLINEEGEDEEDDEEELLDTTAKPIVFTLKAKCPGDSSVRAHI